VSNATQETVLKRIAKQWRAAALLFGVVLTAAWVAVLAWLFFQLVLAA